jgi:hemerythrin-like domain-containing protein
MNVLSTAELREEHQTVRAMMNDLQGRITRALGDPAELSGAAEAVLSFVIEELEPHTAWEQRVVYALVDRFAASDVHPFTSAMRHEHAIIGRWLADLEDALGGARSGTSKNPVRWIIQAIELLGLVRAHLEVEEVVLFPILDAKATPAELRPPNALSAPRATKAATDLP